MRWRGTGGPPSPFCWIWTAFPVRSIECSVVERGALRPDQFRKPQIAAVAAVRRTCREFDVPRSTFYEWKSRFDCEGKTGRNSGRRRTPLISYSTKQTAVL